MIAQAEHAFGHVEYGRRQRGRLPATGLLTASKDFEALAIPSGLGNALTGMASVALATGDGGRAERLLDEATSVLRHAGPWFLTWGLYLRAILAVRREQPDEAIALVRESLTLIRELHDKFAFVYTLVPLAAAAVLKGRRCLGGADSRRPGRRH